MHPRTQGIAIPTMLNMANLRFKLILLKITQQLSKLRYLKCIYLNAPLSVILNNNDANSP